MIGLNLEGGQDEVVLDSGAHCVHRANSRDRPVDPGQVRDQSIGFRRYGGDVGCRNNSYGMLETVLAEVLTETTVVVLIQREVNPGALITPGRSETSSQVREHFRGLLFLHFHRKYFL